MSEHSNPTALTITEFFSSQLEWFKLNRAGDFARKLNCAIEDFQQWRLCDEKIADVTLDLIDEYAKLDDSPSRKQNVQKLRTLRRRYLATRKTGEAIELPPDAPPRSEETPTLEPAPPAGYQPNLSLNYLAQLYVESNPRIRSKHSRVLIRYAIDRFQDFLGRSGLLSDVSDQALVKFAEYRKSLGRSDRTIERELSKISTLWRYAANRGWCPPVFFSVQKCAPPAPTAWSPREMEMIYKAAAEYRSSCGGLPANLVLIAALRLAYDTGERRNAVFAVHWRDIDLESRYVTFRAETRKGGVRAADNVQRFSRRTRKALAELHEHMVLVGKENERVFPEVHVTSMYGHLRLILKNCGLDSGRNCMFHKIRRTHATHLYLAGGDPTQSLGHGSDAMTRGYYLDPKFTRNRFLADMLGVGGVFRRLLGKVKRALGII